MNDMQLVTFEPLDSLFFREAKPFNAGEGGFLDSQFPPPAQTMSGAIRSAIVVAAALDWDKKDAVRRLIGAPGDDPAPLAFSGPYLFNSSGRLYPVPLHLLYSEQEKKWTRLAPSERAFATDMGDRYLPMTETPLEGANPLEEGWLDASTMQTVLNGGFPTRFIPGQDIFLREARAGIGRNNQTSVARDGQLYFTRHLRLQDGVRLGMAASGAKLPGGAMVRLGGEGRLARITVGTMPPALTEPLPDNEPKGLILVLLTHGDFGGKAEPEWNSVYSGVTLVTACIGKAVREGGWDYAQRQPKPLRSLAPAGSCYFVRINNGNLADVVKKLNNSHIGQRTAFGYGEIAVGYWS